MRRLFTRKRILTVVVVVALGATAFAVGRSGTAAPGGGEDEVIVFAPVERRTLQDVLTVQGQVRHEEIGALNMLANGRVTAIEVEDGETVEAGRAVFAVDGRPAIAAKGDFPFWRPLEEGSVGFDVYQLERILADSGYDPGALDLDFTSTTRSALVAWQQDRGYSSTEKEADEVVTVQLQQGSDKYAIGGTVAAAGRIVEQSGGTPAAVAGDTRDAPRVPPTFGRNRPAGTAGPVVNIAVSPTTVSEGSAARVIVTSDIDPTTDLTVMLSVSGTASAGDDYDTLPASVELEVGESRVETTVATFDDAVVESDETIVVMLRPGTGYTVGSAATATVTLTDQTVPELTVDPEEVTVAEGDSTSVTVVADQRLLEDTQVQLAIGGDATPGNPEQPEEEVDIDYVELESTILMPAGSSEATIEIDTLGDAIIEGDEEVTIQVQAAEFPPDAYEVGAVFQSTVTISDAEQLPTLTIRTDDNPTRVSEGTAAPFVVESDFEITGTLDVAFEVSGTVTLDDDYPEPDEEFAFAAGDETALDIATTNDDQVEADEMLIVTLLSGEGYVLADPKSAVVVVESEDVPELEISGGGDTTEGGTIRFTVTADQAPVEDTSVLYTFEGTAQPGADFETLEGVALLRAGSTSFSIDVVTIDDDAIFRPGDFIIGEWPTRIGTVTADIGEFLPEGMEIMTLTEDTLTVTLTINPSDRAELSEGLPATVELSATGASAPGEIVELLDTPDVNESGTETYRGEVSVEGELTVVDGATVNVDVVLQESPEAIVVPVASLVGVGGDTEVRVVQDDGSLERVPVETGLTEGAFVEVLDGLAGDEQVVVEVKAA